MTGAIAVRIFGHAEEREKGPCGGRERERDRDGLGNGGITRALNLLLPQRKQIAETKKESNWGGGVEGEVGSFLSLQISHSLIRKLY